MKFLIAFALLLAGRPLLLAVGAGEIMSHLPAAEHSQCESFASHFFGSERQGTLISILAEEHLSEPKRYAADSGKNVDDGLFVDIGIYGCYSRQGFGEEAYADSHSDRLVFITHSGENEPEIYFPASNPKWENHESLVRYEKIGWHDFIGAGADTDKTAHIYFVKRTDTGDIPGTGGGYLKTKEELLGFYVSSTTVKEVYRGLLAEVDDQCDNYGVGTTEIIRSTLTIISSSNTIEVAGVKTSTVYEPSGPDILGREPFPGVEKSASIKFFKNVWKWDGSTFLQVNDLEQVAPPSSTRATAVPLPAIYVSLENGTFAEYSLVKSTITMTFPLAPIKGAHRNNPRLKFTVNRHRELLLFDSLEGPLLLWDGTAEVPLNQLRSGCAEHKKDDAWEQIRVFLSEKKGVYYVASNCHYITNGDGFPGSNSEVLTIFTLRKYSALKGTKEILRKEYPACVCSTGSCPESCPKGVIHVPGGIFASRFVFTSFIEGQTQSRTEQNTLYTFENWKRDEGVQIPLRLNVADIAPDNTVLGTYDDTACCGWENMDNDQAFVVGPDGESSKIYDEFAAYSNAEIDINFPVSSLAFAPSGEKFASQVTPALAPGGEIRWNGGHIGQGPVDNVTISRLKSLAKAAGGIKIFNKAGRVIKNIPDMNGAISSGWLAEDKILLKGEHKLGIFNLTEDSYQELPVPGMRSVYVPTTERPPAQ